jgi:small subunit ribosomal protein S12
MVTYNQLKLNIRKVRCNFCWSPHLKKNPQRRGRVIRYFTATPRKPNSARRKVAKIIFMDKSIIFTKLIGMGNPPNKFAAVLVSGNGFKDTPSVNYSMVRGALECLPLFNKNRRRSIFGTPKIK